MIEETISTGLKEYERDAIFRIGEVISVNGRGVTVRVDSNKNMPHILYQGSLIKGVAVGSYVKITKGFCSLVGKVESEELRENKNFNPDYHKPEEEFIRCLYLKLIGFFDEGKYKMGVREMPLIGNVCYLLSVDEFSDIHSFCGRQEECISLGHLLVDEQVEIKIGINKLFTTHLGIFGNTGSGKSYTLASVLKAIFDAGKGHDLFQENSQFVVFDFNGEYSSESTINAQKTVYQLNTHTDEGHKIPFKEEDLLEPEIFYILANATEKTQQPFIKRAIDYYKRIHNGKYNENDEIRRTLRIFLSDIISISDGQKAQILLAFMNSLLRKTCEKHNLDFDLKSELIWNSSQGKFYIMINGGRGYLNSSETIALIDNLKISKAINLYEEADSFIDRMIEYLYIKLIDDVLSNRAINEHIAPAINKLIGISSDISRVFDFDANDDFWKGNNLVVIDLNNVGTKMKKLVPLLMSMKSS